MHGTLLLLSVLRTTLSLTWTPDFDMQWSLSGDTMTFTFSCTTGMWCALGFGQGMSNADIIVCDSAQCMDGSSTSQALPPKDAQQDITFGSLGTTGGKYTMQWQRKLQTPDATDAIVTAGAVTNVIYAVGSGGIDANNNYVMHTTRGNGAIIVSSAAVTNIPTTVAPTTAPASANGTEIVFSPDFTMQWTYSAQEITVTFVCTTGRWCSVGFGSSMSNADTVLCYGSVCQDGHVSGYNAPSVDAQQDLSNIGVTTAGGVFKSTWTRKLSTGDAADAVLTGNGDKIIWGVGKMTTVPQEHYAQGSGDVNFISGAASMQEDVHGGVLLWKVLAPLPIIILLGATAFVRPKLLGNPASGAGKMLFKSPVGVVVSLGLVTLSLLLLFFAFYKSKVWFHAFGYVAAALMGIILMLPAGNYSVVWLAMKVPHERVIMYHRWMGMMLPVAMGIHGVGYLIKYDWDSVMFEFDNFGEVSPLAGVLSLGSCMMLVILANPIIRRKVYGVFLVMHWVFIALTVVFACLHSISILLYLIPAVLALLARAIVGEYRDWARVVSRQVAIDGSHVKLRLAAPVTNYNPGDYVFLREKGDAMQSHPFSIVQVAPDAITLCIKNMGPGTSTEAIVNSYASYYRVSEPMGNPSLDLHAYDNIILIGGGVGITPLLGTLYGMAPIHTDKSFHLTWSVRENALVDLLTPELQELSQCKNVRLNIHFTGNGEARSPRNLPMPCRVEYTRPNMASVLSAQKDSLLPSNHMTEHTAVFVCGPPPLVASVKEAAASNPLLAVHVETFEL
eukprot:TRINITY_DN17501_c0_g1_i1.p1 TRINITY_DN17501_c0_g1~~TRINITY_DN17501_c0_g1_i1.p1  ORF type:complete len:786 (+),score=206.17 TRINITY_DN17501_c0_g1_i1:48-2405(+)